MAALGGSGLSQQEQNSPSPQERDWGYFSTGEPSIVCTSIVFHLPWEKGSEHCTERTSAWV